MSGFEIKRIDGTALWSIKAPYFSPKLNSAARSVPGVSWDSKRRAHVGYIDGIEQVALRLAALGLKAPEVAKNTRQWPHNLLVSYEGARDYQRVGIDFLINQAGSGALLADDMGVGKSFQTVKAVRALRRKTVIVCPSHVRGVWERPASGGDPGGEIARWWPKAKIFAPYGVTPKPIPSGTDVFVTHYDIVHAWVAAVLKWARGDMTVVFDEAHALLKSSSRRSEACRTLAHAARGRIALTGTPPTDRVADMFNILDTISPGRFGKEFFGFGLRYCGAEEIEVPGPEDTTKKVWQFKGRSNVPELRQRLDWFCLRRTKREVLKELPAIQRQVIDVEVPAKNRVALNARIVGDKRQMRAVLDSAADGKFKSMIELVRGHLEGGARVVVATYRRAVCEKFAKQLSPVAPTAYIHGGMPRLRRDKIVAEMRKQEGACCLVTNIDCTATGIDLTFASVGVVAELVWEPRDLVQWESRMHRFGQQTDTRVLIQYGIARGTGDELILHAVLGKLDNFLDLVETDEGDGFKEALEGPKDEGLSRLAAALKKMGQKRRQGDP